MDSPIVKGRVDVTPVVQLDTPKNPDSAAIPLDKQGSTKGELFATYDLDHSTPYLAELFGIETLWNDDGLTYKGEIQNLNDYLMQEIKDKNLDNNVESVKKRISALERQASIEPTAPVELRVKLLAEHARYLQKLNNIKLGVRFNGITE